MRPLLAKRQAKSGSGRKILGVFIRQFYHRNSLLRLLGVSGLPVTLLEIDRELRHQCRRVRRCGLLGTSWPTDSAVFWDDLGACRRRALPQLRLDHLAPAAPLKT